MKLQHGSRCTCRLRTPLVMWLGLVLSLSAALAQDNASEASRSRGFSPRDMIPAWPKSVQKREWPDGPIKDYLHNLSRPDNDRHPEREEYSRTCCDAGDTVKTKFKVEPSDARHPEDLWYAWLNEKWVPIPPDKIVASYAPDGQAYLFMMDFAPDYDYEPMSKIIVCFVRPKGGL